ncbi:MAG: FAD-dependent oxidoreductase, partial [Anaerolineales bacterium]|nr:FAD-dependent oxidoreductase [Anaerolineales bacterium]
MAEKDKAGKKTLPKKAKAVIIGGGVIGCSTAYHLAKKGWKDIVLLERAQLTSGTTWHAAGLIEANGFFSATDLDMAQYTLDLYESLIEETDMATGYKGVGMMTLASTADRVEELRRIAAFNRYIGVEVEELTPQQVKEIWPLADTEDVLAGFLA